jgi:hypothetical protein
MAFWVARVRVVVSLPHVLAVGIPENRCTVGAGEDLPTNREHARIFDIGVTHGPFLTYASLQQIALSNLSAVSVVVHLHLLG